MKIRGEAGKAPALLLRMGSASRGPDRVTSSSFALASQVVNGQRSFVSRNAFANEERKETEKSITVIAVPPLST